MNVEIAKFSGYCFGVKRVLDITEQILKKYKNNNVKIYSLGQIIHNKGVVDKLLKKGLIIAADEAEITPGSVFIVRSHGMGPEILKRLKAKNIKIVNATCPFVKNAQSKAKMLSKKGYYLVIIGSKNHPEVIGIRDHIKSKKSVMVIEDEKDIDVLRKNNRIGIVVQTTSTIEKFQLIVSKILEKGNEILIENTICDTTKKRQNSTKELSKKVDVMIIVGGKNSANTAHLAEISKKYNPRTYYIENYKDLNLDWVKGGKNVGISGGASTPQEDIFNVKKLIEEI
jgi:4-hydroxy-3-methylbut-2-enyl diphosphate reductase